MFLNIWTQMKVQVFVLAIKNTCGHHIGITYSVPRCCASLYITSSDNWLTQHIIDHESLITCNTDIQSCFNKPFQTMSGYRIKWSMINRVKVGSHKRHHLLIMCGGNIFYCKYVHCSAFWSFRLRTLMIIHGIGTRGFLKRVYFLAAEARYVLAVLTILLHDAKNFRKSKVQTTMIYAQRKYTIGVIW